MKKHLVYIVGLLLTVNISFAQAKTKPNAKQNQYELQKINDYP